VRRCRWLERSLGLGRPCLTRGMVQELFCPAGGRALPASRLARCCPRPGCCFAAVQKMCSAADCCPLPVPAPWAPHPRVRLDSGQLTGEWKVFEVSAVTGA
jgi:hypothetical protein